MDNPLRDALPIKVSNLLDEPDVLQQHGSTFTGGL
jgi:hypothetical protein